MVRIAVPLSASCTLMASGDGAKLYLTASEDYALMAGKELFSFGAGGWADGREAKEAMADATGRWLACNMQLNSMVIIEKKKRPSHLESMTTERPIELRKALMEMEDAGQALPRHFSTRVLGL